MAQLVVNMDSQILARVSVRAESDGTSPESVAREYLEAFAGTDAVRAIAQRSLLGMALPRARAPWRHQSTSAAFECAVADGKFERRR